MASAASAISRMGGGGGGSNRSDEEVIRGQLDSLSAWALANNADARHDRRRYWLFKIPAIVCAASTSALEAFGFGAVVILLGVVAAVCIAIDAAYPGGLLHNTHRRAANELSLLVDRVQTEWDEITVAWRDASTPEALQERTEALRALLKMLQDEKSRINQYLTAGEASLDTKHSEQH